MLTSRLCGGVLVTSSPPTRTVPEVGSLKPAIIRSVVVLPHPDGPSREKNSPLAMSRSRSSTTVEPPKILVRPRSETDGVVPVGVLVSVLTSVASGDQVQAGRPAAEQAGKGQGGHDQQGGAEQHQGADRVDGRGDPEPDRGVDPHREGLWVDAGGEEREHEVVEDQREDEQPGADQGRDEGRQGDQAQRLERRAAQVARGLLDLRARRRPAGRARSPSRRRSRR